MLPDRGDLALLWDDMREQAFAVSELLRDIDQARFLSDENLRLVAERRIAIIEEAARHISPAFRAAHPEIPLRQIIGQRNILIHDYGQIIPERVAEHPHPRLWTDHPRAGVGKRYARRARTASPPRRLACGGGSVGI